MARKIGKADTDGFGDLIILAGIVLFIPFLVVSFVTFGKLKKDYLGSPTAQRVMDVKRLGPLLVAVGAMIVLCVAAIAVAFGKETVLSTLLGVFLTAIALCAGYVTAKYIAILYLGIIADKNKDALFFPHDLQSYTLTDYLSLQFLKDLCSVDSINLSAIQKMTRGHGKELYVHGAFGSRGIVMSSKQKRDECLAMIQSLSGKKGLLITEIEGY